VERGLSLQLPGLRLLPAGCLDNLFMPLTI